MGSRQPLGQHFLIRGRVIHKIIQALKLNPEDSVLEIGPGKGALTLELLGKMKRLLLVERDEVLAEALQSRLNLPSVEAGSRVKPGMTKGQEESITLRHPGLDPGSSFDSRSIEMKLICADFLQVETESLYETLGKEFKVVSNLPYEVSVAILQKLLALRPLPRLSVLMFQKEVGERLIARPQSKSYGSLSVYVQSLVQVEKVTEVKPEAFLPPPRVDSLVLSLRPREPALLEESGRPRFEKIVQAGFAHRRKMLRQNLKSFVAGNEAASIEARLEKLGAARSARAEELSVEQWVALAGALY